MCTGIDALHSKNHKESRGCAEKYSGAALEAQFNDLNTMRFLNIVAFKLIKLMCVFFSVASKYSAGLVDLKNALIPYQNTSNCSSCIAL